MLPYAYSQLQQAAINYQQQQMFGLDRLRLAAVHHQNGGQGPPPQGSYLIPGYPGMELGYRAFDPRTARFVQEEPKPQHSYIGLIAMAILSNADKKMVLSDIYQWILDHYPYFRSRGPGWRNSIRHNLSLNDCFIKAGRSANGKGHYWAIHPANVEDFKKGDFRRRRAQRKVRKHMGLTVANDDDESDDSPCPSPSLHGLISTPLLAVVDRDKSPEIEPVQSRSRIFLPLAPEGSSISVSQPKKRVFDVESLLAPDCKKTATSDSRNSSSPDEKISPASGGVFNGAGSPNMSFLAAGPQWQLHLPFVQSACGLGSAAPWFRHPIPSPVPANPNPNSEDGRCSPNSNSAAKWQETFAKIMARSYQGRNLLKNADQVGVASDN